MTYTEINEMMSEAVKNYKDYGKHEPLVNLSFVYEDERDGNEIEVVFAVPEGWLCNYKSEENGREWDADDLRDWLCNTYTSEDSQQILENAILENEVAFYVIR